jgi:acyl dehydratase
MNYRSRILRRLLALLDRHRMATSTSDHVVSTAAPSAVAPNSILGNRTFDELKVGDSASLVRIVGGDDIDLFAAVSGDVNPAHLDPTFAATDLFGHIVAHGMWTAAYHVMS